MKRSKMAMRTTISTRILRTKNNVMTSRKERNTFKHKTIYLKLRKQQLMPIKSWQLRKKLWTRLMKRVKLLVP